MRNNKGVALLIGLALWVGVSLILAVILKITNPCSNFGLSFVGFLFLVGGVIFGITGQLAVGGISGVASAVFLFFAFSKCF